jgi:hypothetical protein
VLLNRFLQVRMSKSKMRKRNMSKILKKQGSRSHLKKHGLNPRSRKRSLLTRRIPVRSRKRRYLSFKRGKHHPKKTLRKTLWLRKSLNRSKKLYSLSTLGSERSRI